MIYNVVVAVLAIGLLALGYWGRRHVDELVPSTSMSTRASRRRQYLRGATLCQLIAVLMLVYAAGRIWIVYAQGAPPGR